MELIRALGELAEAPGPDQIRTARLLELPGEPARAEYTDLFVVQLYPYASVYLSPDGQLGGQVQDHIAGFWRVLRQPVPRDPDHIATLFSTYAQLIDRGRENGEAYLQELTRQMRHAFLWEHMISWLLPYMTRVRELGSPVYRSWAMLALDALEAEVTQVGPATTLPLHLRISHAVDFTGTIDETVDALFAPVVSGMVLTRADITRCSRDLGITTRVANRRYTLRSLIQHDSARVHAWIAAEARRQADLFSTTSHSFGDVRSHWERRALIIADALTAIAVRSTAT